MSDPAQHPRGQDCREPAPRARLGDHDDPFDRMLIAQALVEGLPIATADPRFAAYGVRVAW